MFEFKMTGWASDIALVIYIYVFIGCYICASGYIGVYASYRFVNNIYKDLRAE